MKEEMAYIARKSCGCIVGAAVDMPEHRKHAAKEIAKWIKDGLILERVTCQYVRDNMRKCKHGDKKQPQKQEVIKL